MAKHPHAVYPHEVLNIRRKEDLKAALEMYSHPYPMMDGSHIIHHKSGARYLAEWIYPALRWYCKIYGVDVPAWLEAGKEWHNRLGAGDRVRALGRKPLEAREWVEDKRASGARE